MEDRRALMIEIVCWKRLEAPEAVGACSLPVLAWLCSKGIGTSDPDLARQGARPPGRAPRAAGFSDVL